MISIISFLVYIFFFILGMIHLPTEGAIVTVIISPIFFVLHIIGLLVSYSEEVRLQEKIMDYKRRIKIFIEKKEKVLEDIRIELLKYLPHEKDIFKSMNSLKNLRILVTKYPELKSNEVLKTLAESIEENNKEIYDTKEHVSNIYGGLRWAQRSIMRFFHPKDVYGLFKEGDIL